MFGKKKTVREIVYDKTVKTPVIRCSICNGEQVGGLKNAQTGEFEEIMVIRSAADLETFRKLTGWKDEIPRVY